MREQAQTYAVTLVCEGRERLFSFGSNADCMVDLLARYRSEGRFLLHGFVIMPDHMHIMFSPTRSLEAAVGMIKGGFSFAVKKSWRGVVWQDGYYAHRVMNGVDYDSQLRYIADNPERQRLREYPYVHTRHEHLLDGKPDHLGG